MKEYNAAVSALAAEAGHLPHSVVKPPLRSLSQVHGIPFSNGHLELFSRLMQDDDFYRRHPLRAALWLARYARPKTISQRWTELRTGNIHFVA